MHGGRKYFFMLDDVKCRLHWNDQKEVNWKKKTTKKSLNMSIYVRDLTKESQKSRDENYVIGTRFRYVPISFVC